MTRFWMMIVALCVPCLSALNTSKLKQQGPVNDFPHEMGTASRKALEQYCLQLEQKTGVQLVIVFVIQRCHEHDHQLNACFLFQLKAVLFQRLARSSAHLVWKIIDG